MVRLVAVSLEVIYSASSGLKKFSFFDFQQFYSNMYRYMYVYMICVCFESVA